MAGIILVRLAREGFFEETLESGHHSRQKEQI